MKKDKLLFFWSQEWRDIERAPTDRAATVPDPAWLTDPASPQYVPPAERDPNAVALLSAWPAPNTGTNQYRDRPAPTPSARARRSCGSTGRSAPRWRLMARYTHDLSRDDRGRRALLRHRHPGRRPHDLTEVPGQVFVAQLTTAIGSRTLNELSFQVSGNEIESEYGDGGEEPARRLLALRSRSSSRRTAAVSSPPSRSPASRRSGPASSSTNRYRNYTFADNLSRQTGNHTLKGGLPRRLRAEGRDQHERHPGQLHLRRRAAAGPRSRTSSPATRARSAAASCAYAEPEFEVDSQLRWNRYELFVQDSWRARPGLTLDFGAALRRLPGGRGPERRPHELRARRASTRRPPRPGRAPPPPPSWWAAATSRTGSSSPAGPRPTAGASTPREWDDVQPRLGFSWDPKDDGRRRWCAAASASTTTSPSSGSSSRTPFANPPFVTNPVVLNPLSLEPGRRARAAPRCRRWRSSRPATTSRCPARCSGTSACSGGSSAGPSSTSRYLGSRGDRPHPAGRRQRRRCPPDVVAAERRAQPGPALPGLRGHHHAPDDRATRTTTRRRWASATTPGARGRSRSRTP